jgi:hypothetical protein
MNSKLLSQQNVPLGTLNAFKTQENGIIRNCIGLSSKTLSGLPIIYGHL